METMIAKRKEEKWWRKPGSVENVDMGENKKSQIAQNL